MKIPTLGNPTYICELDSTKFVEDIESVYSEDKKLSHGIWLCAMDLDRPLFFPEDYYYFVNGPGYSCRAKKK